MKYKYKIGAILLSICLMLPMFGMSSQAASGKISISRASGKVGSQVTISCTVTCTSGSIGSADIIVGYDQTKLQWVSGTNMATGGSGSVQYAGYATNTTTKSLGFNMTFKILKEGAHSVYTTSVRCYDFNEEEFYPGKASNTITGTVPTTSGGSSGGNSGGNQGGTTQPGKDSNNKLSSLQVYPGTLSPNFSASVKSYNVTVPEDTTKVTISATPQSSKAKVTVSGGDNLQYGLNTAKVIVVAENGASTAYIITVMRGEEEKISVNGKDYVVDENFTDEQIPQNFSRIKVEYKERQYEGLASAKETLKLLCLKDQTESKFFIYDQETESFSELILIERGEGKYIIPLSLEQRAEQYQNAEIINVQIQGKNFEAWKLDEEFCIVYAVNQEGDELLYRYDSVEEIFQRYTDAEIDLEPVEVKPGFVIPNKYYLYTIGGLAAFSLILLISMIYFIASRKHRHEARKKKMQRKLEKQRAKEEKQRLKEERIAEKERIAAEKVAEKERRKEEKRLEKQRRKEQ